MFSIDEERSIDLNCDHSRERSTTIHPENRRDVDILRERAHRGNADGTAPMFIGRPRQDTCPICLTDSSVFSVETNCGHLFCGSLFSCIHEYSMNSFLLGKCIITFWKFQGNWLSGMNCPVCRRPVGYVRRSLICRSKMFPSRWLFCWDVSRPMKMRPLTMLIDKALSMMWLISIDGSRGHHDR